METQEINNKEEKEMHEAFIRASKKFRQATFNKKVNYNRTFFEYADLGEIIDCINKPLLDEGFYICHETYMIDNQQRLKTYLQYKNGKTKGNQDWQITVSGKTMQEIGAQITYIKRYSLSNICSLFAEADNDAKEVEGQSLNNDKPIEKPKPEEKPIEKISPTQIREIDKLLFDLQDSDEKAVLKFCNVKAISEITQDKYETVINNLTARNKKLKEGKNEQSK